jgi:hypothetical protein
MFIDPLFEKVAKIVDPEDKLSGGAIIKLVEEKFTSNTASAPCLCDVCCAATEMQNAIDAARRHHCSTQRKQGAG